MPSHSVKQAKVMSAIAHGWKPKGSVAKIPVKVAKDFHAADAGHKYGAKHKASMARHIARKTAKKADGGKTRFSDLRKSDDVEDRRKESHHRPLVKNVPPDASEPGPIPQPSFISDQLGGLALDKEMDEKGVDFADGGATDDDQKQQAISIHPVVDEPSEADKAAMMPETYANPLVKNMISGLATLPQRAIEASQEDVQHLGEENYEPQSTGPAVETALATMGIPGLGAPAIPGALGAGFGTKLKSVKKAKPAELTLDEAMETAASKPYSASYEGSGHVYYALKQPYPKDVATMAAYKGYSPQEVENIKSHLLPGAQKAFDKHYNKIVPDAAPKPDLKLVPQTDPNYIANYHTNQGTDISKVLENLDKELTPRHAPDDWYEHQYTGPEDHPHIGPEDIDPGYKAKGKDTDIEDYYAEMEKQEKKQSAEWEPDPELDGPTKPENVLHPALSPPDLEQKSAKLGLNTTAFHGTKQNFSEFKLPEEMDRFPELGVHFGTLRAAIDRAGVNLHPLQRNTIENSLKSDPNVTRGALSLRPSVPEPSKGFNVIPARIGADNPLYIYRDLGTWTPSRIRDALHEHPEFTVDEVNNAMNVKGGEDDFSALQEKGTKQIQNLRKLIESHGYDSMSYHNKVEDPGSLSYIIWNLNKARSFYAKFDPAKASSRNLGAAIGGLSLVPLGLYGGHGEPERKAEGGSVTKKDKDPEEHEFIDFKQGGLIDSHIPGRTDKIPMKVSPGSYVLPADIPSALGQGNTKAGSEILKKMFTHSAYGLEPMKAKGHEFKYPHSIFKHKDGGKVKAEKALPEDHQLGMQVPKGGSMCANCKFLASPTTCGNEGFVKWNGGHKLPFPADEYCCDNYGHTKAKGKADGGENDHASIIAAGGEYIIHPDDVKEVGHGDMAKGHKILDQFVLHTRKQHIKTLKGLKGPKK